MSRLPLLKPGECVNYFGTAYMVLDLVESPHKGQQMICYAIYDPKECSIKHINPAFFLQAPAEMVHKDEIMRQVVGYFPQEERVEKLKQFGFFDPNA